MVYGTSNRLQNRIRRHFCPFILRRATCKGTPCFKSSTEARAVNCRKKKCGHSNQLRPKKKLKRLGITRKLAWLLGYLKIFSRFGFHEDPEYLIFFKGLQRPIEGREIHWKRDWALALCKGGDGLCKCRCLSSWQFHSRIFLVEL